MLMRCSMTLAGPALLSDFTTFDAILAGVEARLTGQWATLRTGIRMREGLPAASIWYPATPCRSLVIPLVRATRGADFMAAGLWARYDVTRTYSKNLYTLKTGWFTPQIDWIADVEDEAQVRHLLANLPGIGKKTGLGYGHLIRTTLTPIEGDWAWRDADGWARRPLPAAWQTPEDMLAYLPLTGPAWGGQLAPAVCPPIPMARLQTTIPQALPSTPRST